MSALRHQSRFRGTDSGCHQVLTDFGKH
jgi:hypothetical protein